MAPTVAPDKPFSQYRPPSPISPYLNLYRTPSASGVDNYNLYVRPLLDQEAVNRQTQFQLQNVEASSRFQGSMLQQMEQRNRSIQAPAQASGYMQYQQYFMNFQQYYPGVGQGVAP